MKTGKFIKRITILLILTAAFLLPTIANAATMNNNVNSTDARFTISAAGVANVRASYLGYVNVTTGATIHIKVQRKILFWWSTVDGGEWTDNLYGYTNQTSHSVNLTTTDNYRAVFEFTVRGSGGSDDEIEIIRYADYE